MADRGRKAFPYASAIIFEHDTKKSYGIHRHRLKNTTSSLDICPPVDHAHFHYNAKRAMQQAERLYEIERENRILLSKMDKCAAYSGARDFRPWRSRSCLNYKQGLVLHPSTGLQIDNKRMLPHNRSFGACKSAYQKQQEAEHLMRENLKIQKAIETRKPFYSARAWEHQHLEDVSRIDRLQKYRGPESARYRSAAVDRSLELAKSMRSSRRLPGTDGYQRDLAASMKRSSTFRSGAFSLKSSTGDDFLERPMTGSLDSAAYRKQSSVTFPAVDGNNTDGSLLTAQPVSQASNSVADNDPAADLPQPEAEAVEPVVAEPEADTFVANAQAAEPETAEPETAEPETAEPEAAEPEAAEQETAEPEAAEPDAAEPGAAEADAGKPEVEPEGTVAAVQDAPAAESDAPSAAEEVAPTGPTNVVDEAAGELSEQAGVSAASCDEAAQNDAAAIAAASDAQQTEEAAEGAAELDAGQQVEDGLETAVDEPGMEAPDAPEDGAQADQASEPTNDSVGLREQ